MNKKFAFTLAEILVCLMIIGVIAGIFMKNIKGESFTKKSYIANAYKVINAFDQASTKIIETDPTSCPTGTFLTKAAGLKDPEYTFSNSAGGNANTSEVLKVYSKFIKFEQSSINFCDYTGYCTDTSIKGGRLHGNVYMGIKVGGSAANCPSYYLPNASGAITVGANTKCWGNLYIDVDGLKGPNKLGEDVFIFGLGARGIAR